MKNKILERTTCTEHKSHGCFIAWNKTIEEKFTYAVLQFFSTARWTKDEQIHITIETLEQGVRYIQS